MVLLSLVAQHWPTFTSIVTKNTGTSLLLSLIPAVHTLSHTHTVCLGLWWDGLTDASQWAAPCQCGVNTCESSSVSHKPNVPGALGAHTRTVYLPKPPKLTTARHLSQHIFLIFLRIGLQLNLFDIKVDFVFISLWHLVWLCVCFFIFFKIFFYGH